MNSMNPMRERAKEHLPMVLLTLLSIVQALAIELLWSQVRESTHLFDLNWGAFLSWIQVITTCLGIVVIWVVYASTAMRFRWVPTTSDSVYPFVVGIFEFIQIELLAPQYMGRWFICLAAIIALMTWVSHAKMRRARHDEENAKFFAKFAPATVRDFYAVIGLCGVLCGVGIYLMASGNRGWPALIAVTSALLIVVYQLAIAARFWNASVSE